MGTGRDRRHRAHQASRHPIEQLSKRLGFTHEQVFLNLAERGKCVSASIPLALAEAVERRRIQRGDRVLLIGTGAGLTLGAVALTCSRTRLANNPEARVRT